MCLPKAYDQTQPWWWRGLMAWRATGTELFPSNLLPTVKGNWEAYVDAFPDKVQLIMTGFGARQREAHPIFLPLAYQARQDDPTAQVVNYQLPLAKHGEWLLPALDKHTWEGKQALYRLWNQFPVNDRRTLQTKLRKDNPIEVLGTLFFWLSGSKVNQNWNYQLSSQINLQVKQHWLAHYNLSGKWLLETFGKSILLEQAKEQVVLDKLTHPKPRF